MRAQSSPRAIRVPLCQTPTRPPHPQSPSTRWGATLPPVRSSSGVVAAARALPTSVRLVGPLATIEAELSTCPDRRALAVAIVDAPDVVGMNEAPTAGAAAQARRVDSRRGAAGRRRPRLGDRLGGQHRGDRDGGAHRAWADRGRGTAGAGGDHPDQAAPGGPARRRRQRRVPARPSGAVRRDGDGVRTDCAGTGAAARGAAVDRRRRVQGQRADARGASAAEEGAGPLRRQRRSARCLCRRGRRDRLRRLHRQRRAQDQREPGGHDRDAGRAER